MHSQGKINMRHRNHKTAMPAAHKRLFLSVIGAMALITAGCNSERDEKDGQLVNAIVLPTDVVLGLYCEDVGVHPETCVLDDPANPFAMTTITEFDVNNPGAENKFDLFNSLPPGPAGAKARFYFWATALARRPSGENQFYTAQALHELFDANSNDLAQDELIRAQALKAYRSVLDNFFGSVTVFTCCPGVSPDGEPVAFPVGLNALSADSLYRTERTGYRRLVPGAPLLVLELLLDWGYLYIPGTEDNNYDDGVVSVIEG